MPKCELLFLIPIVLLCLFHRTSQYEDRFEALRRMAEQNKQNILLSESLSEPKVQRIPGDTVDVTGTPRRDTSQPEANPADVYLKRHALRLLSLFDMVPVPENEEDSFALSLHIAINLRDLTRWRKKASQETLSASDRSDLDGFLAKMVSAKNVFQDSYKPGGGISLSSILSFNFIPAEPIFFFKLMFVIVVVVTPLYGIVALVLRHRGPLEVFILCILVWFLITPLWTALNLYQEEQAKRLYEMKQQLPSHCFLDSSSTWRDWFKSFIWSRNDPQCYRDERLLTTDALSSINMFRIVSETFGELVHVCSPFLRVINSLPYLSQLMWMVAFIVVVLLLASRFMANMTTFLWTPRRAALDDRSRVEDLHRSISAPAIPCLNCGHNQREICHERSYKSPTEYQRSVSTPSPGRGTSTEVSDESSACGGCMATRRSGEIQMKPDEVRREAAVENIRMRATQSQSRQVCTQTVEEALSDPRSQKCELRLRPQSGSKTVEVQFNPESRQLYRVEESEDRDRRDGSPPQLRDREVIRSRGGQDPTDEDEGVEVLEGSNTEESYFIQRLRNVLETDEPSDSE
ncbi:unnamed protein product [Cyprideis torosa]|uniref:Chloride channel CLIC-like protein 1 n=1 Tax=Cyprideis torosa TaxID=163714 RepID=A0A7R8WB65_9CRUS|nr:unnamed protein product [Cyprideis torosa]CAG0885979.1 unnamed protein product [Cyprideis torosa]